MKCCLVILLSLVTCKVFSQDVQIHPIGVYKGGICLDEAICGTWYIKQDSTFVFLDFYNMKLKSFGTGSWLLKNKNNIEFKFNEELLPVLKNVKINYQSETKKSYDSIYIYGQINAVSKYGKDIILGLFNNQYYVRVDKKGEFRGVFIRDSKFIKNNLIIRDLPDSLATIEIQLSSQSNYHTLIIDIPKEDSFSANMIYRTNPFFVSTQQSGKASFFLNSRNDQKNRWNNIVFVSNDKNILIDKLKTAKKEQPQLSSNINYLISFINK